MAMDDLSVSVLGRDTVCLPTDTGFSLEDYVLLLCIDVGQTYFLCRSILPEYVYIHAPHVLPFACGGQKWVSDPLDLGFRAVVSCLVASWVMRLNPGLLQEQCACEEKLRSSFHL